MPIGTTKALIRGYLPDMPELVGQRLRIICNGVPVLEQAVPQGQFQLAFNCTDTDQPPNIVIRALKHIPRKIGNSDRRKLAYHLQKIICAERRD